MKNIRIILISVIMLLSIFLISAVAQVGFDEWGFNFNARIFNGLLGNTDQDVDGDPDTYGGSATFPLEYYDAYGDFYKVLIDVAGAHVVGKWSKGFHIDPVVPDEVGAWYTYHIEGTGKIYDIDEKTIYEGHLTIFCKIQFVCEGQYGITQLVINGQGIVVSEIPTGFGAHPFPKEQY